MKQLLLCLAFFILVAAPCAAQDAKGPFADVPANHWAYQDVDTLQKAGIVFGNPDSAGNGRRDITQYDIAVAIARLLSQVFARPSQTRSDIRTRLLASPPAMPALQELVRRFKPELIRLNVDVDGVDVDGLQARLAALAATEPRPLAAQPFADVPPNHWAASAVETLRQNGIVAGYPGGSYTTR